MEKRLYRTDPVEDSGNGVESAKVAGMRAVGYRNQSPEEWGLSAADAVAESSTVLRTIFEGYYIKKQRKAVATT